MPENKILSKGEYTRSTPNGTVSARQYIILKENGKKKLLLRMANDRDEALCAISFNLVQYNIRGDILAKDKIDMQIKAAPHSVFEPNGGFELLRATEDFDVEILSASYGDYTYMAKGDAVQSVFVKNNSPSKKKGGDYIDRTREYSIMKEKKSALTARTLRSPRFFVPFIFLMVLALSVFIGFRVLGFGDGRDTFTLNGCKYEFVTEDTVKLVSYSGRSDSLVIDDSIEGYKIVGIEPRAFFNANVKDVVINNIPVIANEAFIGSRIESLTINNVEYIGTAAFSGCTKLAQVNIGEGTTVLPSEAFYNCRSLLYINLPTTLVTLGDRAFAECGSLRELHLPEGVTYIGTDVVRKCGSLTALTIPYIGICREDDVMLPGGFDELLSQDKTLSGMLGPVEERPALVLVTILGGGDILEETFRDEKYLKNIVYTEPITSIGDRAFYNCESLLAFNIPETVGSVGVYAFNNCKEMQTLSITAPIVSIPNGMLFGCEKLTAFAIPDTVISIGSNAFAECKSLKSLTIPGKIQSVGSSFLKGCSSLEYLNVPQLYGTTIRGMFGDSPTQALKTVVLGSAEVIPEKCFQGFSGLQSVSIPENITAIGNNAFSGCAKLQSIIIPASVRTIGRFAFSGCKALNNVHLPAIQVLEEGTFDECTSLSSIVLPTELQSIHANVFRNCSSLLRIDITDNVVSVGRGSFSGCTKLSAVTLGKNMTSIEEELFMGCTSLQEVFIGGKITTIGARAFQSCTRLNQIVIPSNVTQIGSSAFRSCTSMYSITLPFVGTSRSMGSFSELFGGSTPASLKTVIINDDSGASLAMSDYAFSNCTGVETIDFSGAELLTAFSNYAFNNCKSLKTIIFPPNIASFGNNCFINCSSLTTMELPNTVTSVGKACFLGCNKLESLSFTNESQLAARVYYMFNSGSTGVFPESFKTAYIKDGVQSIPASAFHGCSTLVTIHISDDVTAIGNNAFYACRALKNINLTDSLTEIGNSAFGNCTSLTELSLPFIGANKANGTNGFAHFFSSSNYSNAVPESLEKVIIRGGVIQSNAFYGCTFLKEVEFAENCGITSISSQAFYGCTSLRKITFPPSLTALGSNAFTNCYNLRIAVNKSSTPINGMSNYSYSDISKYLLTNVSSSGEVQQMSVNSIDMLYSNIKNNWYAISCNIPNTEEKQKFELNFPSSFTYRGTIVSSYIIADYFAYGDAYRIPGRLTGIDVSPAVTAIGQNAFAGCGVLRSFHLQSGTSLKDIGANAFYSCYELRVLTIPTGCRVGAGAFSGCSKLLVAFNHTGNALSIGCTPKVELGLSYSSSKLQDKNVNGINFVKIADRWFAESGANTQELTNVNLTSISDSDGLTNNYIYILSNAFSSNSAIKSVSIGSRVALIESNAFYGCSNLATLTFESSAVGLSTIGSGAFKQCNKLNSLSLPTTIKKIGDEAFYGCSAMTSLTLNSVTDIGASAFYSCTKLSKVIIPESVNTIGNGAFASTYIWEVVNLSDSFTVAPGANNSAGGVAANAIAVRGEGENHFVNQKVNGNGFIATFAVDTASGKAYLCRVESTSWVDILYLPELIVTEVSSEPIKYSIHNTAFSHCSMGGIVINKYVSQISAKLSGGSTSAYSSLRVYYEGNESGFKNLISGGNFGGTKYYYSEGCIHDSYRWNYEDGAVNTAITDRDTVEITPATCQTEGTNKYVCSVCKADRGSAPNTERLVHTVGEDGKCVNSGCNAVATKVTSENFATIFPTKNNTTTDGSNRYVIDENGVITSTNKADGSSSSLRYTATKDCTLIFSYMASSESSDRFNIVKNNSMSSVGMASGTSSTYQSVSVNLKAGDFITFTYNKDSSVSSGDDCGYIKDMMIVANP